MSDGFQVMNVNAGDSVKVGRRKVDLCVPSVLQLASTVDFKTVPGEDRTSCCFLHFKKHGVHIFSCWKYFSDPLASAFPRLGLQIPPLARFGRLFAVYQEMRVRDTLPGQFHHS